MVYDAKAILPIDLDYGAPRIMQYREQEAKEYLKDTLDQLDEARDVVLHLAGGVGFSMSPHSRLTRTLFVADVARLQSVCGLILSTPKSPLDKWTNPRAPARTHILSVVRDGP
jgi:hypothetical protein